MHPQRHPLQPLPLGTHADKMKQGKARRRKALRRARIFRFGSALGKGVLRGVVLVGLPVAPVVLPGGPESRMEVQTVAGGVYHAPGDVGAVVGGALQVGEKVAPYKTGLDAAVPLLHPQDVPGAHLLLQSVDHLLQGLHLGGRRRAPCRAAPPPRSAR